jgi:phosphate transport system permease protein
MTFPTTPSSSETFAEPTPFAHRSPVAKGLDIGFIALTCISAFAIAGVLIAIAALVGWNAWPAISRFGLGFLTSDAWDPVKNAYGAITMIYGTMITSFFAILLAVPIGVGTAIFLSENYLPRSIRTVLVFMIELLAAIPSVVYGVWGIIVLIPFLVPIGDWLNQNLGWIPLFSTMPSGPGLLPAILVLTVMILPIITAISRDSLAALPPDLRQASLGLGATRWETIFRVLLPAAFSGIVGAIGFSPGTSHG